MQRSVTDADRMGDAQLEAELTALQELRAEEIRNVANIITRRAELDRKLDIRLAAKRESVAQMDARIEDITTRRRHTSMMHRQHLVDDTTSGVAVTPFAAERLHDQAHGAKRQAGLARLLREGKGRDITIRVLTRLEDGAAATGASVAAIELGAHRLVLAAVSEPLDQMIFGAMACVDEANVLTLSDGIEPMALRSVVEYAYNGTLELTQDTMWGVLKACMYLELGGAIGLCTAFLSAQLTPANVFGVVNAARDLHCAELEAAALAFTKAHMAAVSEGAEWLEMPEEVAASLARGTHPLSAVVPQLVLLEALGRWVEYLLAPNERRGAFVQWVASDDAMTQNNLGLCYDHGWGVAKDFDAAVVWYTKAAEQGCAAGQNNLGLCYSDGVGMTQDFGEAAVWYAEAAEQGLAEAQFHLGICYDAGKGVAQDQRKAMECYTKAAEQGLAHGQCSLGGCYMLGEGVAQDFCKAVVWYTKAAEQGHAEAQYNLGTCYEDGKGVARDLGKAVEWHTKAAEQWNAGARAILELPNFLAMRRAIASYRARE